MTSNSERRATTTLPIITPIILSGGSGARLWPLSTDADPKQFHALGTSDSLLTETMRRLTSSELVTFRSPSFVAAVQHGAQIAQECAACHVDVGAIVLEPRARNTAAAAYVAAAIVAAEDPDQLVLLAPADHVIRDTAAFHRAIARAAGLASSHIVTFGIAPQGPETGFGYIKEGAPLAPDVFKIERFVEKPDLPKAKQYLSDGGYVWNAGIFLFRAGLMIQEMVRYAPDVARRAQSALDKAMHDGAFVRLEETEFTAAPTLSVDVAVMEKTELAAVTPCDMGWSDIGSWSELWRLGPRDAAGNSAKGATALIDVRDSLLWCEGGPPIAAIGVEGLIIVSTSAGVIVAPMDRAQEVKLAVEAVKKLGEE